MARDALSASAPGGADAGGGPALAELLALDPAAVRVAADGLGRTADGLADAAHVLDGWEVDWRGQACTAAEGASTRRGRALRGASTVFHDASVALALHAAVVEEAWLRAGALSRSVREHDAVLASGVPAPEVTASREGLVRQAEIQAEAVAGSGRSAALALGVGAGRAPAAGDLGDRAWAVTERTIVSSAYGVGETLVDLANLAEGAAVIGVASNAQALGIGLSPDLERRDAVYRRRVGSAVQTVRDYPGAAVAAMVNLPLLRSDPARWTADLLTGAWVSAGTGGLVAPAALGARASRVGRAVGRVAVAGRSGLVSTRQVALEGARAVSRERLAARLAQPLPPPPEPRRPLVAPEPVAAVVGPVGSGAAGVRGVATAGREVAGAAAWTGYQGRVAVVGAQRAAATVEGVAREAGAGAVRGVDAVVDAAVEARVKGGRALVAATEGAREALRRAGVALGRDAGDAGRVVVHVERLGAAGRAAAMDALGAVSEGLGGVTSVVRSLVRDGGVPGWRVTTAAGVELVWTVGEAPAGRAGAALGAGIAALRTETAGIAGLLSRSHVAGAAVSVGGWSVARLGQGLVVAQRAGVLPAGGVRATLVWSAGEAESVVGAGGLTYRNARDSDAQEARLVVELEAALVLRERAASVPAGGLVLAGA